MPAVCAFAGNRQIQICLPVKSVHKTHLVIVVGLATIKACCKIGTFIFYSA
jgi:hypothetical protein